MGIQEKMTDAEKLEYRKNNPLCIFCEHGYYKFFKTWCKVHNTPDKLCAKTCPYYSPTLEPIDKRSS